MPAILNDISFESTEWYEPSYSSTWKSTSGKPASTPRADASWIPLSTAGMNFDGIDAADDLVVEQVALAARQRRHADPAVAELSAAARLLLVAPLPFAPAR